MDLYEELMGAAPTNQQKAAEIAAALRKRGTRGKLGILTGDKILGALGANDIKQADAYAERFQDTRQKDADNAQTKSYQDAQIGHMGSQLTQSLNIANMNDATQRRGQDMTLEAALARAAASNKPKIGKLTYADRNKLEMLANTRNGIQSSLDTFDPGYAQQLAKGPVPEMGQSRLSNAIAAMGAGSENMDKAANWWSAWNVMYTLPQRNSTFGATLTPNERQAWFESDINPSMKPEQIQQRMGVILNIMQKKGVLADKTYRAQGFDDEAMDAYDLGEGGFTPVPGDEHAAPTADPASMARQKRMAEIKAQLEAMGGQ